MRSMRTRAARTLAATAALAIGVVPATMATSSILAAGEGSTTISSAAVSAGSVSLRTTSAQGTITWRNETQTFTGGQQCEVTSSGANILEITGSIGELESGVLQSGVAGFRDGDIGVFEASASDSSPTNASQCFRVDSGSSTPTESLTLALHPQGSFSDQPFAPRLTIGTATVDARVANSRDGLITISYLDANKSLPPLGTTTRPWSRAKAGDAIDVGTLTAPAGTDAIRLTATSGSFSLSGADLNLSSAAEANLCPTKNLKDGDDVVTYVNPTGACFGATFETDATHVTFLKPSTVAPDAQFRFVKTWTTDNTGHLPTVSLGKTEIDFEIGATNVNELKFCSTYPASILSGPAGSMTITNFAAFKADNVNFPDFDGGDGPSGDKQFACIDTRTSTVTPSNVTVTDTILAVGDLRMSYGG